MATKSELDRSLEAVAEALAQVRAQRKRLNQQEGELLQRQNQLYADKARSLDREYNTQRALGIAQAQRIGDAQSNLGLAG